MFSSDLLEFESVEKVSKVILPSLDNLLIGRKTELCSISLIKTWSPCFRTPLIIKLSPYVQVGTKITFSGAGAFTSVQISSLHS